MTDSDFILRALMGIGTLGIGWAGWVLSKRGQRDTREQQAAANMLQTRVNTVDELESVITHLKAERDRAEAERDRLAAQHTAESQAQAARCQVQIDRLVDNVATLQSIVSDEIARAAALGAVQDAQRHETDDHGREWGGEAGGGVRY